MNATGNRFLRHSATGGFTMIEVILTITIAAILGTLAIQFSGSSLSMSAQTVVRIKDSYTLSGVMEKITRDYGTWLEDFPAAPISEFETAVKADYGTSTSPTTKVYVDKDKTGTDSSYFVDSDPNTGDVTIDLLHLTLTDGTQSLVALFTK